MSDPTVSVSKGVFVFKNGFKPGSTKSKNKNKQSSTKTYNSILENKLWYKSYSKLWNKIEKKIQDSSDSDEKINTRIKKSQCTFSLLQGWYEASYPIESPKRTKKPPKKRKILVVVIPDFESFNDKILQDFVLIISSYLNVLPFALVFGVATSTSALHKSLPHHVSSRISVKVFQSQTSVVYLNNILENIFLTADCPFHLGGRIFSLFIDQFLFYDLSVKGFIRNVKYAMLEHYSYGNAMALCTDQKHLKSLLNEFTHDDFENVRHLISFRSLVENEQPDNRIKLLTNDDFLKDVLHQEITTFLEYLRTFHLFLKCLYVLVQDLPNNPLGKQFRELYRTSVNELITSTDEFRQSFRLLGFQSKDELLIKLTWIAHLIGSEGNDSVGIKKVIKTLNAFVKQIENFNLKMEESGDEENDDVVVVTKAKSRQELKEKLLKMTHESKPLNKYEKMRKELLTFLTQTFEKYLNTPKELPFHEIFIFNDISIRQHIEGIQMASLHEALVNPQAYLQCQCCTLPNNSSILKTMPDVCILYKLHLECGKLINLYDLLQSFLVIVEPENNEDCKAIKPELQARFTQAVAELEYLGFVKSSKRKADHVTRLTWSA
ncbi:origin recognition complex subunit 3 isoform X2 [Agrilus planipennis]|uniref:Origin recognition complex subunit 3 n=1 Tax=Agrilus planipennis TaxID=224129 RepID=A0A7F5R2E8_AGRPL|nr:origin recognition complex subunit 3 isoform X2 [Agrilus planipennis]